MLLRGCLVAAGLAGLLASCAVATLDPTSPAAGRHYRARRGFGQRHRGYHGDGYRQRPKRFDRALHLHLGHDQVPGRHLRLAGGCHRRLGEQDDIGRGEVHDRAVREDGQDLSGA